MSNRTKMSEEMRMRALLNRILELLESALEIGMMSCTGT
jgi:hypothetical protein